MLELSSVLSKPILTYMTPIIEIGILTVLIYQLIYYIRGTRGAPVLSGFLIVIMLLTIGADYLRFDVLSWLLNEFWTFLAIALIVIFQPEFRRAFSRIGSTPLPKGERKLETINEILTAVINMAGKKHGALIVIEQSIGMKALSDNSVTIEAKLSHRLLETIFSPNTPLHDGGVIIKNGKIKAAHCIFPLSTNPELVKALGTRHRAALGVTEETDALVVVVSEETGGISVAYKGNIKKNVKPDKLRRFMNALINDIANKSFKEIVNEMAESEKPAGFSKENE